jgi:D-amino peptidase
VKIYISADIEGVAGVVLPLHGTPGNGEYEEARRLMTEETNAAIAGAFAGGAVEVLVNDSHGPMINLRPELLDPRAELIRGNIKPAGMFAGLDDSYAGVMCVGYHAAAAEHGVLAHTTNGSAFTAVRLNGMAASEAMIYGAYAGSMGVPVIFLSGDDVTERTCGGLFPGAEFVRVKTALGQRGAGGTRRGQHQALSRGRARRRGVRSDQRDARGYGRHRPARHPLCAADGGLQDRDRSGRDPLDARLLDDVESSALEHHQPDWNRQAMSG